MSHFCGLIVLHKAFSLIEYKKKLKEKIMPFKTAKCPNCAGDIEVPEDRDSAKCKYCGGDVFFKESIKIVGGVNIYSLLNLARIAEKSNARESYKYYSQVLENDHTNSEAWMGRGRLCLRTRFNLSPDAILLHFENALKFSNDKHSLTNEIVEILNDYLGRCIYPHGFYGMSEFLEKLEPENIYVTWNKALDILIKKNISLDLNEDFDENKTDYAFALIKKIINASDEINSFICVNLKSLICENIDMSLILTVNQVNTIKRRKYLMQFLEDTFPMYEGLKYISNKINIDYANYNKSGPCFIATAVYGSPMASEVILLRTFRDEYLVTTIFGKAFIRLYYILSPPVAEIISNINSFKVIFKMILKPIIWSVKNHYQKRAKIPKRGTSMQ